MRSYLSLVPISARVHKRQNRMTLLCIILSVFLVTAIFSMADIWIKGEGEAMIKKHGTHHIILSGISENAARQIAERADVSLSAWRHMVNYDLSDPLYRIGEKNITLYRTDSAYISGIRNYETEGGYPQSGTQVMLSADAKEGLGVQIGDSVTISTPEGDFDYTVSGFCVDDLEYNDLIDGLCTYMTADGFDRIFPDGPERARSGYYIRFAKGANLRKAISDLKEQYDLAEGDVEENKATLALSGASSNKSINGMYPLAIAAFLLILTSGVLMISSCMNSNISQRTQFFGMMRCIGASRKQIIHYVRLEALNWCKSAVPMGCILGTAVTWVMCLFLRNMVGGEFAVLSFRPSVFGIVFGIAVGVITVLLAAHSPAKRAAGVSPMTAVSGNAETGKAVAHAANIRLFKIETALGVRHATAARKNLTLMTLSFAFTVILFFSFFALLDFARALIPSLNGFTPDVAIVSADQSRHLFAKNCAEELSGIPGVEVVYGTAFAINTPALVNGAEDTIDLLSYDDYMLDWSKDSVASGDISKITDGSGYALTIFNRDSILKVGDKIRTGDTELEIACAVSQGVWGDARAAVICSEKTFERITGEKNYMILNAKLTKDATEETVNAIRALAGDNIFSDYRKGNAENYSSYWVFRIAAYGFLAVIALITIFNIMNSISMSVTARMKQYGAMRAVGMSAGQLTKMIAAEAVTYAACGLLIGDAAGLYLHWLITDRLIIRQFGGHWKIPPEPIAIIVPIVVLSLAAAVYAPAKRIRNMEITATINEL